MMLNGGSKTCCGMGILFPQVSSSFRDAPPEPGFTRVRTCHLSKSATADLDGAGPESILPMVVMDSGFATSSRPGMTASLDSQSLNPMRAPRQRDVLGFHIEV